MNLHKDLREVHIAHDCSQCKCRDKCRNSGMNVPCEEFYPAEMSEFMDYVISKLKERVVPSTEKRLKRRPAESKIPYDDKIPPLDHYYVLLVNDVLSQIRKGKVDYIYSFGLLSDILRFERDIGAKYIPDAGAYAIFLV